MNPAERKRGSIFVFLHRNNDLLDVSARTKKLPARAGSFFFSLGIGNVLLGFPRRAFLRAAPAFMQGAGFLPRAASAPTGFFAALPRRVRETGFHVLSFEMSTFFYR